MKTTIQNIYKSCNLDLSAINSEAIDILVEILENHDHSLSEPCEFIQDIGEWDSEESMLEALQEYQEEMQSEYSELIEALETLDSKTDFTEGADDDFYFDYDGNEYRVISESSIWDIYVEEIRYIVTDCCDLRLDNIPDFVAMQIDWEQTAKNAYVDGYGYTFSGYDGSELETKNYYIFRTN
jgi:hypothetical protein